MPRAWCTGISCYECLTGSPPFTGTPVEVALAYACGKLPALPPHVPADVATLVASLTAADPACRPASAPEVAALAGRLRDALPPGGTAGTAAARDVRLAAEPGPAHAQAPDTLAEPTLFPWASPRTAGLPGLSRDRNRVPVLALAAGAAVIIAVLAGWLLSGGRGSGGSPAARHGTSRIPVTASPAPPRLVWVSRADWVGLPVSAMRRELRGLGLRVRVTGRHDGQQKPGTVISVAPAGRLAAGTTVTVTGALAPAGHGDGSPGPAPGRGPGPAPGPGPGPAPGHGPAPAPGHGPGHGHG